jgi:hypothetical protein
MPRGMRNTPFGPRSANDGLGFYVAGINIPYHITQRGNARRLVFEVDTGRLVYLRLLQCPPNSFGRIP